MQVLRNVISGGEPSALYYAMRLLTKEEKMSLTGMGDLGPGEGLQVVG